MLNLEKIIIGAYTFELPSKDFNNRIDEIQTKNNWQNKEIEKIGKRLASKGDDLNPIIWWYFSRLVCSWGRGMRVWANLNRHHNGDPQVPNEDIGNNLKNAFLTALKKDSAQEAMSCLLQNDSRKGLGVSFLSKHLRMLQPEQYAVLDSVLENSTGFAMNPSGYQIFMNSLHEQIDTAKHLSGKSFNIADFEAAIFLLAGGGAGENQVPPNHDQYLQATQALLKKAEIRIG